MRGMVRWRSPRREERRVTGKRDLQRTLMRLSILEEERFSSRIPNEMHFLALPLFRDRHSGYRHKKKKGLVSSPFIIDFDRLSQCKKHVKHQPEGIPFTQWVDHSGPKVWPSLASTNALSGCFNISP